MKDQNNNPHKRREQDKEIIIYFIVKQVESGTGLSLHELQNQYSEEKLFSVGLRHVTTTKKAICEALGISVEYAFRYKRKLEKAGQLVQSAEKVVCPYTKHYAHMISTNPSEFDKLKGIEL